MSLTPVVEVAKLAPKLPFVSLSNFGVGPLGLAAPPPPPPQQQQQQQRNDRLVSRGDHHAPAAASA